MNGTKPWYQSLATWGGLTTVIASLLALLKYRVDAQLLNDLRDWVLSLITLVSGAVALYGRIRATKRIGDPNAPTPTSNGFRLLLVLLLFSLPLLGGCQSALNPFKAPAPDYVAADRATYDAVAPEYTAYVAADPSLDAGQIARRQRTVATWRRRIERGEKTSPATQPAVDAGAAPATQPAEAPPPTN